MLLSTWGNRLGNSSQVHSDLCSAGLGSLVSRLGQELREMANVIRQYAKAERPKFEQPKAIGMRVVTPTGLTLFQRPKTFDMTAPGGFFLSEIVRKMDADKELNEWN